LHAKRSHLFDAKDLAGLGHVLPTKSLTDQISPIKNLGQD
jgi:hypothetical protein